MMNGRTELAAGLTAVLNGIFGILAALNIINLQPEIVASINGVMIPIVILFLGNRVTKVENTGLDTNRTAKRVEAAQPEPASNTLNTSGSQSAYAYSSSNGNKPNVNESGQRPVSTELTKVGTKP